MCYNCLLIFALSSVVDVFFKLLKATSQILSDAAILRINQELHSFFVCLFVFVFFACTSTYVYSSTLAGAFHPAAQNSDDTLH